MIVFNGVSLDSIARVMIEDIKVSPISLNAVARPRAIQYGSEFVRMRGGERTITVSFAVLDADRTTRHETFINLAKWARNDAEYLLELPTDNVKGLYCVCTGRPDPSTRAWWENKLKLTFTCFNNPYWTSKAEKSVACNTQFTVLGDAPPLMRIEETLTSAATGRSYTDGTDTMLFTFGGAVSGRFVLDLNKQTASVGNASVMQYYSPSSTFIIPKVGTQTITGNSTIYYRERWE